MRIPRVSRGISALKNGKRRREGDRRGAEWGQAGRERVGEGAVVSERTMGGIYLHYDTGSTSSFFFFPFSFHDAETRSRALASIRHESCSYTKIDRLISNAFPWK